MSANSWQAFALASAFFAGLTAVLGKLGVAEINSNLATLVRTLVIFILTAIIVSWRHQWEWASLNSRSMGFLVLSGITTGLSWLCYYRALQLGQASQVAPVDKLSVAFAVALAVVFLGEALTWKLAAGVLLILAGSLVMLL